MSGTLGHLSIVIAFVSVLAAGIAYFIGSRGGSPADRNGWLKYARVNFYIHTLAVTASMLALYSILFLHQWEYEYAWAHASNELPFYFIISSFWEGQEGSFLLWIFWNSLIGLLLIKNVGRSMENPVMVVFCTIQLFLVSMVLGCYISPDLRLGSSPFLLLKDTAASDIFKINPSFVPLNGTGLNPLLQNIWMVIHPPVIFLGFALSGVPFAFAMAALWLKKPGLLIKKVAPWLLSTLIVLGLGIIMGAYWAYETLNFGGYWNWDPVENAVLVPWLVFLGASHGLVLYKRKKKGLALTFLLLLSGFLLIVYSTFLTRSGVLGNASVHAFTDLGLSGQLLSFLLFFLAISAILFISRRKSLADAEENTPILSLDFWMILAVSLFCLSAFQVIVPTSIPVFNALMEQLGIKSNFAPPADQVAFYSRFQIWFAVGFCLAAGTGQLFYWRKIRSFKALENELLLPAIGTLLIASLLIMVGKTRDLSYIALIVSAVYLLMVSFQLLFRLFSQAGSASVGGMLAHIGLAIMLLGFVYSAGHQRVISHNVTINAPGSDLPVHTVRKNLLLSRNVPKENGGYLITYRGSGFEQAGTGNIIHADHTLATREENLKIISVSLPHQDKKRPAYGDTVEIVTKNRFYTLDFKSKGGDAFTIRPRMQNNPSMGFIASPDIESFFTKDIYTHITNFPDPEKISWKNEGTHTLSVGEELHLLGLRFRLEKVAVNEKPAGIRSSSRDLPLEATVIVSDEHETYTAKPLFYISEEGNIRLFPDKIDALGIKITLSKIDPETGRYELSLESSNRDWVTIESIELPFISLVWFGSLLMIGGICLSLYFKLREAWVQKKGLVGLASADQLIYKAPEVLVVQKETVNI